MKRVSTVLVTALAFTACRDTAEPGIASPLFSPATISSWTPIASMGAERYAGAAATGTDGRIYVFGGVTISSTSSGAEVYDPSTDTWNPIADPGLTILGAVARGGDGRIYLAGGDGDLGFGTTTTRAYDPGSNTYTTVAPMNVGRYAPASATGLDGRVYVIGGQDPSTGPTTSAEAYNPSTDTWTMIAPTSVAHVGGVAATGPDGRIYVTGTASGEDAAAVEAYDPGTNTWSSVASLPLAGYGQGMAAGGDGNIYVFGGVDVSGSAFSASAYAYEPATDTWTTVNSLGAPRYLPAGAAGLDGRIYALGGFDGVGTVLTSAEMLETATTDTQAPTISLVVNQSSPWPPNHRMVRVATGISATDDQDATPTLAVTVTSNEPDNGLGDGDVAGDTQVVNNGDGTFDVFVRAERGGKGDGRTYTITATATDDAGNTGTMSGTVSVPKSKGR